MSDTSYLKLFEDLRATQNSAIEILNTVLDAPDWTPNSEHWSFRYIAAHLSSVEEECFLERVKRLASEDRPQFSYYENTGWDFSQHKIEDSINRWVAAREDIFDQINGMSELQRNRVGVHEEFGEMSTLHILELMLSHDQEHLEELKENLQQYRQSEASK